MPRLTGSWISLATTKEAAQKAYVRYHLDEQGRVTIHLEQLLPKEEGNTGNSKESRSRRRYRTKTCRSISRNYKSSTVLARSMSRTARAWTVEELSKLGSVLQRINHHDAAGAAHAEGIDHHSYSSPPHPDG